MISNAIEILMEKRQKLWKYVQNASFMTLNVRREAFGLPPLTNINAVTTGGKETSLHIAVRCYNKEVSDLLLNKGANINAVERLEWTPLHAALRYICEDLVELLLDRRGTVNTVDNLGMAPLHFALKYGREELVGLLLNKGASVN